MQAESQGSDSTRVSSVRLRGSAVRVVGLTCGGLVTPACNKSSDITTQRGKVRMSYTSSSDAAPPDALYRSDKAGQTKHRNQLCKLPFGPEHVFVDELFQPLRLAPKIITTFRTIVTGQTDCVTMNVRSHFATSRTMALLRLPSREEFSRAAPRGAHRTATTVLRPHTRSTVRSDV